MLNIQKIFTEYITNNKINQFHNFADYTVIANWCVAAVIFVKMVAPEALRVMIIILQDPVINL